MNLLINKKCFFLLFSNFEIISDIDYITIYFDSNFLIYFIIVLYFILIFFSLFIFFYFFIFNKVIYFISLYFKIVYLYFLKFKILSYSFSSFFLFTIFNFSDYLFFFLNEFFENPILVFYEFFNTYIISFLNINFYSFWLNYYYYFFTAPIWSDKEVWFYLINSYNFWPRDLRLFLILFISGSIIFIFLFIYFFFLSKFLIYLKSLKLNLIFNDFLNGLFNNLYFYFYHLLFTFFKRKYFIKKFYRPRNFIFINFSFIKSAFKYVLLKVTQSDLYFYYNQQYNNYNFLKYYFGNLIHAYSLIKIPSNKEKFSINNHLKYKNKYYKYLFKYFKIKRIILIIQKFLYFFRPLNKNSHLLIINQIKKVNLKPIFVEKNIKISYYFFFNKKCLKKKINAKNNDITFIKSKNYKRPLIISNITFYLYLWRQIFFYKFNYKF